VKGSHSRHTWESEDRKLDVISAAGLLNRMQRLVQVTHKVDDPFKRFPTGSRTKLFRRPEFFESFDTVHTQL